MKALVIYDSNFGNTKLIADSIAKGLGVNVETVHASDFLISKLQDVSFIVVGSPIIGWKPTEKIDAFLNNLPANALRGINAVSFDTRVKLFIHGDAAKKITAKLTELGAKIIAEPMPFYVKGKEGPLLPDEEKKANAWAVKLLNQIVL